MLKRLAVVIFGAVLAIPLLAGGKIEEKGQYDLLLNGVNKGWERYKVEVDKKRDQWNIHSEVYYKQPFPPSKRGYIDMHFYPDYTQALSTSKFIEYNYRITIRDFSDTDLVEAENSATEVIDQDRRVYDFTEAYARQTDDLMKDRIDLGVNAGSLTRLANGVHFYQTKALLSRVKDETTKGTLFVVDPLAFCLYTPLLQKLTGEGPSWQGSIAFPQFMKYRPGTIECLGVEATNFSNQTCLLKHYDVRIPEGLYSSFWVDRAGKVVMITVPMDGVVAILSKYVPQPFAKAEPRVTHSEIVEKSSFTEKTERVEAGGVTIGATLTLPGGQGPFPVALIVQEVAATDRDGNLAGGGPQAAPVKQLAYLLAEKGVASVRYDSRGVGDSTGDPEKSGFSEKASDVVALARWLQGRSEVKPNGIFFLGTGVGGWIAASAAASFKPAGLVLIGYPGKGVLRLWKEQAGSVDNPDDMRKAYADLESLDAELKGKGEWATYQGRRRYLPVIREMAALDPLAILKADSDIPMLLAYPAKDTMVQPFHKDITSPALSPRQESVILDGVGHFLQKVDPVRGASGIVDRDGVGVLAAWIHKRMQG